MKLEPTWSGSAGLIDVQPDGISPFDTSSDRMLFPPSLGTGTIQRFGLGPSLFLMLHQYTLTTDVQLRRRSEPGDEDVITFSFRDVLRPATPPPPAPYLPGRLPSVRVSSSDIDLDLYFTAGSPINTILIGIHAGLLRQLLPRENRHPIVQTLLAPQQSYLYEAIGSPAMGQIAAELMAYNPADPLLTLFLTTKAQALLYRFISQLLRRETKVTYPLRDEDAKTLLAVRDRLVGELSVPPNVPQLARASGMSASKLRRLFGQVFGMSLYEYYQRVRMHEAARLLSEAHLSVSETGYRLGYTNLSHFTRVFETHMGRKPKQYAKTVVSGTTD